MAGNRKYFFNERFFEVLRGEAQAYFLGLMITDGNIAKGRNRLSCYLQLQDASILRQFLKRLRFRPRFALKRKEYACKGRRGVCLGFDLDSPVIVRDLNRLGVTAKKSLTVVFPKNVPQRLLRHCVRGIFDGDGHIGGGEWYVAMGSERFMCRLARILSAVAGRKFRLEKRKGASRWQVRGDKNDWQVLDWVYGDARYFIARKMRAYQAGKPRVRLQSSRARDFCLRSNGGTVWITCSKCGRTFQEYANRYDHFKQQYYFCGVCRTRKGEFVSASKTQEYFSRGWRARSR